jgi:hypothetical protein
MLEIAIVLATLVLLTAGSLSAAAFTPDLLLQVGFWTAATGLAFGLPTGALYHLGLHRSLARVGRLPRRWWLHPTAHHRLLPPEDAAGVLAWCRAGALGCAVVFLGCAVAALGVWKALA